MDEYDYSNFKLPEEATISPTEMFLESSLKQEIIQFNCQFNLAPQESGKISIPSYLNVRWVNFYSMCVKNCL